MPYDRLAAEVYSSNLLVSTKISSFTRCHPTFAYMLVIIFFAGRARLVRGDELNKHEGVEDSKSSLKTILIVVIIVAALFIGFMIYACRVKMKKQRKLEETRKKIGGIVVTAGTVGSQASSSGAASKTGARNNGSVDEEELKKFTCRGPVVMQARLSGEVKHALDNSPSQSLKNPLEFDPAHNEIVYIGTDVDRIKSVPKSKEPSEGRVLNIDKNRSGEHKISNELTGDCTQQSEAQHSRWPNIKTALPSIPTHHLAEIEVTQTGSAEATNIGTSKKALKTASLPDQPHRTPPRKDREHKKPDIVIERHKASFTYSGASASSTSAQQHGNLVGVAGTPHFGPRKKDSATVSKEERGTISREEKNTISKEERHRTAADSSSSHSSKKVKKSRRRVSSLHPTQEDSDEEA